MLRGGNRRHICGCFGDFCILVTPSNKHLLRSEITQTLNKSKEGRKKKRRRQKII